MSKFRKLGNQLYSGERSIEFVGRKKIWYAIAAVAVILAISLPILRGGFNFGIVPRLFHHERFRKTSTRQERL